MEHVHGYNYIKYGCVFVIVLVMLLFIMEKKEYFNIHGLHRAMSYKNLQKCYAINGYTYIEPNTPSFIERKTVKCILEPNETSKLMRQDSIFVPSLMNDTYCDILYTTYYDYSDLSVMKNRVCNLNMPLTKCIRIRRYHFAPNIYFEIKYFGGTKIRAQIDDNYNLLDEQMVGDEYKNTVTSIIKKIKTKKLMPIFHNTYKRYSFIYKNNSNMRMTIDTNIEFSQNHIYNRMDKDVLEIKIPNTISVGEVENYIKEITQLTGVNLNFVNFSKFEYYYYNVINREQPNYSSAFC